MGTADLKYFRGIEDTQSFDVLIIGGGGAGASAAIWAAKGAESVAIVNKGIFGKSGCTPMGGFSMCAAFGYADPRDSPRAHLKDTIKSGQSINDQDLVNLFVNEAPARVNDLISYGARLDLENDKLHQVLMPGHSYPRACHYKRKTGPMVMGTLARKVQGIDRIKIFNEILVVEIVINEGGCHYAIGVRLLDSKIILFRAKSIVIATGGGSQIYQNSTNPLDATGDGMSLVLQAGGELADMEFIQFLPTAQCYPKLLGLGPSCPVFIRIRTEAKLINSLGEDFLENEIPEWRFKLGRDALSLYIYKEIIEGRGTPHGGVYMDLRHLDPKTIKQRLALSGYYEKALRSGVDLTKDRIETTVAAHFFMGGVRINTRGETSIPGVFACGEAATGFHGANRLAGNALSEILVSGSLAGRNAGNRASSMPFKRQPMKNLKRRIERIDLLIEKWKRKKNGVRPISLKNTLKEIMWKYAGVVRDEIKLRQGMVLIDDLKKQAKNLMICDEKTFNRELLDAFELIHMLEISSVILRSALLRNESRGAHYREDFPHKDDATWIANTVINKTGNFLNLQRVKNKTVNKKNDYK